MDAVEFSMYLQTSVMPLYPDAKETPGKIVLIIVDSGPGRLDLDMLATLRARGFYLMTGVYYYQGKWHTSIGIWRWWIWIKEHI